MIQLILIGLFMGLGDSLLIYLYLEPINMNLNPKKGHTEFWGKLLAVVHCI